MTPTPAQLQVIKVLSSNREARINGVYRLCHTGKVSQEIKVRPEVVSDMVNAGYLTHIVHRNAHGGAEHEWRLTALGLGVYAHEVAATEPHKPARRAAPKRPNLTAAHIEILALLCSAPKAVLLPNGNFRGTKPIPGIERDRACTQVILNMQALGLIERAPGGLRVPMMRATVKGIEALAEYIYQDRRHRQVCICGQAKGEHTDTSHVFVDQMDVAVVDFIEAMLKERENVEQAA